MVGEEVGEWLEIALKKLRNKKNARRRFKIARKWIFPVLGVDLRVLLNIGSGRSDVDQDAAEEDDLAEHVQIREVDLVGVELLAVVGADQDAAAGPV